jgi:hypothetical protein
VTLLIVLATPGATWFSSDHRLTEYPSGRVVDDLAPKTIGASQADGELVVAFTGLAKVAGLDTATWIAGRLKGAILVRQLVIRVMDEMNALFAGNATGRLIPHTFVMAGTERDESVVYAVSNVEHVQGRPWVDQSEFRMSRIRVNEPTLLTYGRREAVDANTRANLLGALKRGPKGRKQIQQILIEANQRAAKVDKTISQSCTVRFSRRGGRGNARTVGVDKPLERMDPFVFRGMHIDGFGAMWANLEVAMANERAKNIEVGRSLIASSGRPEFRGWAEQVGRGTLINLSDFPPLRPRASTKQLAIEAAKQEIADLLDTSPSNFDLVLYDPKLQVEEGRH